MFLLGVLFSVCSAHNAVCLLNPCRTLHPCHTWEEVMDMHKWGVYVPGGKLTLLLNSRVVLSGVRTYVWRLDSGNGWLLDLLTCLF